MPDKDLPEDQGPSLELPSLSFRRRKKAAAEPASVPDEAPKAEAVPAPEPMPEVEAVPEPEPTQVLTPVEPRRVKVVKTPKAPKAPKEPRPPKAPRAKSRREKPRSRALGAILIGLLSGFALVGLINATLHACDAARGTSSCGGGGLFVLLIILGLIVLGATRLLRLWGFGDGGTVAFLGVALVAIIAMVFLSAHLLSLTMVLVIPVMTAVTFLVGSMVSSTMAAADQS